MQTKISSMNDLGLTYADQERWVDAADVLAQAAQGLKMVNGEHHPHTLATVSSLADVQRLRAQAKPINELENTSPIRISMQDQSAGGRAVE